MAGFSDAKTRKQDMTQGGIALKLVLFVIPLVLGDLLQQFYTVADSIIVGQFVGKAAFAAVSSTYTIINTLVGFFTGISIGATSVIARQFGAHNEKGLRQAVFTTVIMTFTVGLILTAIGVTATPALLTLMKTPADVYAEAVTYLHIYFGGVWALVIYNMFSGILRAVGDSRRPLYFLAFTSVLNLLLDCLFVMVFRWGTLGAAAATVLSEILAAGALLVLLSGPEEICRIEWKRENFRPDMLRDIFGIGLPMGIQKSLTSLSNVVVISYINKFGTDVIAGWGAYQRIDHFIFLPMQSFAMTITTFVSQNLGARKFGRLKKGIVTALLINSSVTVVLILAICACGRPVTAMFCSDEAVIDAGVYFIRLLAPLTVLHILGNILAGALRGMGKSTVPMIIMLVTLVAGRQLFLLVGTRFFHDVGFVALSYPFGWFMNGLLILAYWLLENPIGRLREKYGEAETAE